MGGRSARERSWRGSGAGGGSGFDGGGDGGFRHARGVAERRTPGASGERRLPVNCGGVSPDAQRAAGCGWSWQGRGVMMGHERRDAATPLGERVVDLGTRDDRCRVWPVPRGVVPRVLVSLADHFWPRQRDLSARRLCLCRHVIGAPRDADVGGRSRRWGGRSRVRSSRAPLLRATHEHRRRERARRSRHVAVRQERLLARRADRGIVRGVSRDVGPHASCGRVLLRRLLLSARAMRSTAHRRGAGGHGAKCAHREAPLGERRGCRAGVVLTATRQKKTAPGTGGGGNPPALLPRSRARRVPAWPRRAFAYLRQSSGSPVAHVRSRRAYLKREAVPPHPREHRVLAGFHGAHVRPRWGVERINPLAACRSQAQRRIYGHGDARLQHGAHGLGA